MKALNIITIVLFDNVLWYYSLTTLLVIIGYCGIFKKCKAGAWKAFIPCYRHYLLGKCTDMEKEGLIVMFLDALHIIYLLAYEFGAMNGSMPTGISLIALVAELIASLLLMKIIVGLTDLFGLKRRWTLFFIFATCIASPILGWCSKYQPKWTIKEFQNKVENFFSTAEADVLKNGLTVNLEERSVIHLLRRKYLLRDIHLSIQPGHMVLLLGGSGAGKTTFVQAINGYEKAKAKITLDGDNLYTHYKKMQYEIGFVPQLDLMRGSDTVYSTLMDAALLRLPETFTKAERKARVQEVMKMFGLLPVRSSMVEKLSGGQRKRLSIAMEFIPNPTLFILDEPDSGLDGVMAMSLMQQLRSIADQGKVVIVITHTPDRVIDLFDDVIVLAKDKNRTGRLAFFGSIPDARAFFGKDRMEQIVRCINRTEEGGEGRADEMIERFVEVQNG